LPWARRVYIMTDWPDRLCRILDPIDGEVKGLQSRSDFDLNGDMPRQKASTRAAVLVPLVERPTGWQLLLTRRTESMPTHAGQIAFPGGRSNAGENLIDTALREFEEETGIGKTRARMLGRFERYETASGFDITPFVAVLQTPITPRPDPREVEAVFEVPFDFLMDVNNHQRQSLHWQGAERHFYAMPWNEHFIWGATAGMLRALALRLEAKTGKEDTPCCE
jgi:8-oxo-dGTP pyrophosphatase MutT (NUDIX family)